MKTLKKIGGLLNQGLGFVASLITIILVFVDAKKNALWLSIAIISWLGINILFVVAQVLRTKYAAKLIKLKYYENEERINAGLHKYLHSLRDYSSAIDISKKANRKELNKSCELLCANINEIFQNICKDVLDENESFATCVKTVKAESISDTDYNSWRLETFGRSPSTLADRKRADLDDILVSENTDFLVIVEGKTNYIAFNDMRNIEEKFLTKYRTEYKNSRKNFIDYYRSCIIMPIEIDWENASDKIRRTLSLSPKKKLLLGFLCIDTMKVFETQEEIKTFECAIEVAKALGDSLYVFFEKVLILQMKHKAQG